MMILLMSPRRTEPAKGAKGVNKKEGNMRMGAGVGTATPGAQHLPLRAGCVCVWGGVCDGGGVPELHSAHCLQPRTCAHINSCTRNAKNIHR